MTEGQLEERVAEAIYFKFFPTTSCPFAGAPPNLRDHYLIAAKAALAVLSHGEPEDPVADHFAIRVGTGVPERASRSHRGEQLTPEQAQALLSSRCEPMSYEDTRRLIVLDRLGGGVDAPTAAAMLSLLDKKEAAGEPCPGWVALEEEARG